MNLHQKKFDIISLKERQKNCWKKITHKTLVGSQQNMYHGLLQCFFNWQIFAKFRLEKYDFDKYKGFFIEKKKARIHHILKEKKKNSNHQTFMIKVLVGSQ